MRKYVIIFMCISLIQSTLTSCQDWLDVKPKTSVDEETLYEKEQGFKEALAGIYISLSNTNLYGRELSYGILDGLAQRYRVYQTFYDYTNPDLYVYPSTMNENKINAIWSKSYNVLANINNLLDWIDKKGASVIKTEGYKDIIEGEALGLRAFLHFDLLRMWGPIYKDNPSSPSIIYRSCFDRVDKQLMPATEVVDSIIIDLKRAEELLVNDPMNIDFPTYNDSNNDFLHYRFKRMNKYAIKGLLARIYMYIGDKTNALKYANEVIKAQNKNGNLAFRLVTDNTSDKIFSTEILFSISIKDFDKQVENDFLMSNWTYYFSFDIDHVYKIFDTGKEGFNDMRLRDGQGFTIGTSSCATMKYHQKGAYSFAITNTIPLIRLPEMYYIYAECTSDLKEATNMINIVRSARGIDDIAVFNTEQERLDAIEKEFRKEFYAEGQLWFFYKRHAYKKFIGYPHVTDLTEKEYRFSIPEDEVVLGTIN